MAHAVVPSEWEEVYRRGPTLPADFIVTHIQAANSLLEKMLSEGARKEEIHAGIFGCRFKPLDKGDTANDIIGDTNASEAVTALRVLEIPTFYNVSRTPYDIGITLDPSGISLNILKPDTYEVLKQANLPYI